MIHAALIVAVVAGVTVALRFFPFVIFSGKRSTPSFVLYLGRVLPYAIMGMLVVYCLRGISFAALSGFVPQLIAVSVTVLVQVLRRNSLLSIVSGTLCYMLLVQLVF